MADVRVKGLAELQKALDTLPAKIQKNVLRGALRAGVKTIIPLAKANIHNVSGELARTLDARGAIGTKTKGGTVIARLRAGTGLGRKGTEPANLPLWLEFGTAAHRIVASKAKTLFFGIFAKATQHPGARPKPFMRPAIDAGAAGAVVAAANYMKERLSKKEGLDTSYIKIEGDET